MVPPTPHNNPTRTQKKEKKKVGVGLQGEVIEFKILLYAASLDIQFSYEGPL